VSGMHVVLSIMHIACKTGSDLQSRCLQTEFYVYIYRYHILCINILYFSLLNPSGNFTYHQL
jgi:hypothetical protein